MIKTEQKLQKIYLSYYNLLIVESLWRGHYQILSIIFNYLNLELNVNTNMMIRNVKPVELNISITAVFLNTHILKII